MLTVGNGYQNINMNTALNQTSFAANPAIQLKSGKSVFVNSEKPTKSSKSDILGYSLLALLAGTAMFKNEKILEFLKFIKQQEEKHGLMETIKNNSSNLVSLFKNINSKFIAKTRAVYVYNARYNLKVKDN